MSIRASTNQIRNPDGWWINSQVFREEALHFLKYGYYCSYQEGSPAWIDYWQEQLRRCRDGYEVSGVKITGDHYNYLNFSQIKLTDNNSKNKRAVVKSRTFPHFWDGDYDYFWNIKLAWEGIHENSIVKNEQELLDLKLINNIPNDQWEGGYNFIVGKKRRAGYSYKNASLLTNTYNTIPESLCIVGAADKKYLIPEGTLGMVNEYLNFYNKNTGFAKNRDYIDKVDHKKASFKETKNGISYEGGYKSQIMGLYFKDNPDAARGKDARYIFYEEAGKFPLLIDSWKATAAALEDGDFKVGQQVAFGTSGSIEKGGKDFVEMFYNPRRFGAIAYDNTWDDEDEKKQCSYFVPAYQNHPGSIDDQGNSLKEQAIAKDDIKRQEIIDTASDASDLISHKQEFPRTPAEAFATNKNSIFPTELLSAQIKRVKNNDLDKIHGTAGKLTRENGKLKFIPDLDNKLNPIRDYDTQREHKPISSALIVVEPPSPKVKDNPNKYYIGYDCYGQDSSTTDSLASIYVYKSHIQGEYNHNMIVAWYVGKMEAVDDVTDLFLDLCEWYNSKGMHENQFIHVKQRAKYTRRLQLLQAEPSGVISAAIKDSKVSRKYGIHMTTQLIDAAEKYVIDWLKQVRDYDEDGNKRYNIEYIYDLGLLQELVAYNRDGNFDRVIALFCIMFDMQESMMPINSEEDKKKTKEILRQLDNYIINRK